MSTPLRGLRDVPGAAWGSAASAVTFDLSHANVAEADGTNVVNVDTVAGSNNTSKTNARNINGGTVERSELSGSPTKVSLLVAPTHGGYPPRPSSSLLSYGEGNISAVAVSTVDPTGPITALSNVTRRPSSEGMAGAGVEAREVIGTDAESSCTGHDQDAQQNQLLKRKEGVTEWWHEALDPSSRPVTRRSLVDGATGTDCCVWEQEKQKGENEVAAGQEGVSDRPATAPTCGFLTESKQLRLEGSLKWRCKIIWG